MVLETWTDYCLKDIPCGNITLVVFLGFAIFLGIVLYMSWKASRPEA